MGTIIIDDNYDRKMNYKFSTKNADFFSHSETELVKLFIFSKGTSKCQTWEKSMKILDQKVAKEKVLEEVSRIDEKEFILPIDVLYKKNIDTQNLRGYSMHNYSDYITLTSKLDELSFNERVALANRVCDIFTCLEKYNLTYWDVHLSNILINNLNDLKVCDIDSITSKKVDGSFIYRVDLACSSVNLSTAILSILYGIDELIISDLIQKNKNKSLIKKNRLFSEIISDKGNIFYPQDYLDEFSEEYVEDTKKVLKKI